MSETITAVIPVYNGEDYIEKALVSLLGQIAAIDKIIIIDDASTDKTCSIVRKYLNQYSNLELYENKHNKGVSYCRNKACSLAKSKWLLFLDSDDIIDEKLVDITLKKISISSAVLFHSAYQQIDDTGTCISVASKFKQVKDEEILGYEFVRNHVYLSGTILRRDIFIKCGGFNSDVRICEDWDLWIKIAQMGGFYYIDEVLVLVRRHSTNVSSKVETVTTASKIILNQYSLTFIQEAIARRKLPQVKNKVDFVSILITLEHWEKIKKILLDVIASEPEYSIAYFYLGLYYFHANDVSSAEFHFKKAIELNSSDAGSWNNLGVCYAIRGKKTQGKKCFNIALDKIDNYMDATRNIKFIEEVDYKGRYRITWKELRPVLLTYTD